MFKSCRYFLLTFPRLIAMLLLFVLISQPFLIQPLAHAQAATPTPTKIGTRPGRQQTNPVSSGSIVVWVDQSNNFSERNTADILGYDFATNQPITVTTAPGDQLSPAISGSNVVWTSTKPQIPGNSGNYDIYAKNLQTGVEYQITNGLRVISPAIDGNTVVWINLKGESSYEIVSTELGTSTFKTIATTTRQFSPPAISAELIVWIEYDCIDRCRFGLIEGTLRAYDRKSGLTQDVARLTRSAGCYVTGRKIFVFAGLGTATLFDLAANTQLNFGSGYFRTPAIVGHNILWVRGDNGWRAYIYNFKTAEIGRMTAGVATEPAFPTIAGDYLVWQADGGGQSGYGIYTLPLAQAFEPIFNDKSFSETWNKVDKAVKEVPNVGRGYTWGPPVLGTLDTTSELYDDKFRSVQYFDKARMEVNPGGSGSYRVTTGLLVKELVSGLRQDGDKAFTKLTPSTVQVAGDPNIGGNSLAPTYASFAKVATISGDENGQPQAQNSLITTRIDKAGTVTNFTPPEARQYSGYDPVTKHNIADVFVNFGQQRGLIWDGSNFVEGSVFFDDPTYILGRPITEAYWLRAKVGVVETDVLVQLFERRVLTYTPTNPEGYKVEMGNVGQHYYQWRYNRSL